MFEFLIIFAGGVILMAMLMVMCTAIQNKGKTEEEIIADNKAIEEWFKSHPIICLLCFFLLSPLLMMLLVAIFQPGVKDKREIDYSSYQSNIQPSKN